MTKGRGLTPAERNAANVDDNAAEPLVAFDPVTYRADLTAPASTSGSDD